MSGLILPNKWTSQPQAPVGIDWSNPLSPKSGIWIPDRNLVNGRGITLGGSGGVPTSTIIRSGRALYTNGQYVQTDNPANAFSVCTWLAIIKPAAAPTSTNYSAFFQTSQVTLNWNHAAAGYQGAFTINNGGTYPTAKFTSGFTAGAEVVIGGTYDGTSLRIYRNGVLENTVVAGNSLSGVTVNSLQFLGGQGGTASWDGSCSLFYWDQTKAVTSAGMALLSANPWQIFKAPQRRIWVASTGTDTPVNPGVGTIAITGYAPSIAQTANQAITPNVGNIVITGYAPTISQPQAVNPGAGTITITGYAPTVTQNVDVPINPGVGTIAITGYAPAVSQTANQLITPDVGNIAITGYSPTVSQSANQAVTPDVGTINITGYAPIVQQAPASQNITPGVGTITITGYAPTVEQSSPLRLGGFEYGSKVYIKRNKKIYIFDSVEEADSYIEAEAKAEEIVQQSNKTSRLARKRAREKAHKSLAIEPVETVDIPALKTLVAQLQIDFELPKLIAKQDWQRVVEIYNQAMEMQDEEDLLLIL